MYLVYICVWQRDKGYRKMYRETGEVCLHIQSTTNQDKGKHNKILQVVDKHYCEHDMTSTLINA